VLQGTAGRGCRGRSHSVLPLGTVATGLRSGAENPGREAITSQQLDTKGKPVSLATVLYSSQKVIFLLNLSSDLA